MIKFNKSHYIFIIGVLTGSIFSMISNSFKVVILISCYFILLSLFIMEILIYINKEINSLKVLTVQYDKNLRCLKITMFNNHLLESEALFKAIYNTLMTNDEFKFLGFQKIIILSCVLENNKECNLHSNILIDNDTSFEEYYSYTSKELSNYNNLLYGYNNENVNRYIIKVWNVDNDKNLKIKQTFNAIKNLNSYNSAVKAKYFRIYKKHATRNVRLFSTSIVLNNKHWSKGLISPISLLNKKGELKLKHPKPIFSMDIETVKLNSIQIPIAITSCGYNNYKFESKLFLIDDILLQKNQDLALKQLWLKYFTYLENLIKTSSYNMDKLTIFAHNLGDFDGYFLYKGLLNNYNPDNINSIIDESNSFISITHNTFPIIEWKDSLRIFPASLDNLCKMFGVKGKLMPYNIKFSNLLMFNNPMLFSSFKKYSLQDAISLFKALQVAQSTYFDKFKVDIESVYSTATLSLKIFRSNFLDKPIYILPPNIDTFIRNGYFGGGTDVYKAYGKNLYYYDVNSLYPFAMLNPMPYDILNNGKLINLVNRNLDSFFGFAEVLVQCPDTMLRPVLPFHKDGKTIYPTGTWKGVYFSEELKAVVKLGYQITLIRGYEFTKTDLFSNYVKHFYEIKRLAKGAEKQMAKLQLNNLYGYFGRKQITINTQNVKNIDLKDLLLHSIVKSVTPINNNYSTVLSYSNVNYDLLQKLNNEFHSVNSFNTPIMSNVAIAAAVTAYARIIMIPIKIDPNTLYTDTDSAFTSKIIDASLLGDEIGQYKDELKGQLIGEAYFLGPKKYGYYIIENEIRKEFSVFSGVPRNSLSFNEVKAIFNGEILTKTVESRFFKSFNSLNITIKDTNISIKNSNSKELVNNQYLPPNISNGYHNEGIYPPHPSLWPGARRASR